MKLTEKIEEIENLGRYSENGYSVWSTEVLNKQSMELEKIADDYAIEFANWLMDCHISILTLKEFKKQKGL